jgi:hypothetical protein
MYWSDLRLTFDLWPLLCTGIACSMSISNGSASTAPNGCWRRCVVGWRSAPSTRPTDRPRRASYLASVVSAPGPGSTWEELTMTDRLPISQKRSRYGGGRIMCVCGSREWKCVFMWDEFSVGVAWVGVLGQVSSLTSGFNQRWWRGRQFHRNWTDMWGWGGGGACGLFVGQGVSHLSPLDKSTISQKLSSYGVGGDIRVYVSMCKEIVSLITMFLVCVCGGVCIGILWAGVCEYVLEHIIMVIV